jgi:hypothetical protein
METLKSIAGHVKLYQLQKFITLCPFCTSYRIQILHLKKIKLSETVAKLFVDIFDKMIVLRSGIKAAFHPSLYSDVLYFYRV